MKNKSNNNIKVVLESGDSYTIKRKRLLQNERLDENSKFCQLRVDDNIKKIPSQALAITTTRQYKSHNNDEQYITPIYKVAYTVKMMQQRRLRKLAHRTLII